MTLTRSCNNPDLGTHFQTEFSFSSLSKKLLQVNFKMILHSSPPPPPHCWSPSAAQWSHARAALVRTPLHQAGVGGPHFLHLSSLGLCQLCLVKPSILSYANPGLWGLPLLGNSPALLYTPPACLQSSADCSDPKSRMVSHVGVAPR